MSSSANTAAPGHPAAPPSIGPVTRSWLRGHRPRSSSLSSAPDDTTNQPITDDHIRTLCLEVLSNQITNPTSVLRNTLSGEHQIVARIENQIGQLQDDFQVFEGIHRTNTVDQDTKSNDLAAKLAALEAQVKELQDKLASTTTSLERDITTLKETAATAVPPPAQPSITITAPNVQTNPTTPAPVQVSNQTSTMKLKVSDLPKFSNNNNADSVGDGSIKYQLSFNKVVLLIPRSLRNFHYYFSLLPVTAVEQLLLNRPTVDEPRLTSRSESMSHPTRRAQTSKGV
ncbi:hypothetical protein M231_04081 [Tremella mesenterica]|uniref:Uncharacterized protein n=1 Tax=Tremella mesenterica TaxID=5217 RepID=A0A4Q1BLA8_TREME|nr:hypothetical protein M231_04081 [Tremella mesenterica]